jgi:hypothetical protein
LQKTRRELNGGAKMNRSNLHYVWGAISNNLYPIIGAAIIGLCAVVTWSFNSEVLILTVTAIIIYWYTIETRMMRKQIVSENEIKIMPTLVFKLNRNKKEFILENYGEFPAFNISFDEIERNLGPPWVGWTIRGERIPEMGDLTIIPDPIESIIQREMKPVTFTILKKDPEKPEDEPQIFDDQEVEYFLENKFIPLLNNYNFNLQITFYNVVGEKYTTKLGFGSNGTKLTRPTKLK